MAAKRNLILMTGTPLTTPMDVFGYSRLLNPAEYPTKAWFELQHVAGRDMFNQVTAYKNETELNENFLFNGARVFRREIDPDLPQVIYEPIFYELDAEHKEAYDYLAENSLVEIEGQKIDANTVQKLNTTLQQIIIGYEEFFDTAAKRKLARKKVKGFELLDQIMAELGDRKLIVFAYYQKAIRALKDYSKKYQAVEVYGAMNASQREANIEQFVSDPNCRILIGQPISMGSGLDNLKNVCSDVLFLELPMIAKDFTQAVGRIDRNGQKNRCHVRIAVAEGTLQVRRQKTLLDKDAQANKIQFTYKDLRSWIFGA